MVGDEGADSALLAGNIREKVVIERDRSLKKQGFYTCFLPGFMLAKHKVVGSTPITRSTFKPLVFRGLFICSGAGESVPIPICLLVSPQFHFSVSFVPSIRDFNKISG